MYVIFQSALWRWNIKLISTLRVDRHEAPCLSRVSPYTVILWLSTPLVLHILSHVVKRSASSKMVWFFSRHYVGESSKSSALRGSIGIKPHVYQGFPLRWLFNDSLHPLLRIFYRPLWNIPPGVKWLEVSVGTMEVNYQIHRHSEGWSASGFMCIRGFPLYGYLMSVTTPTCAYYTARCE